MSDEFTSSGQSDAGDAEDAADAHEQPDEITQPLIPPDVNAANAASISGADEMPTQPIQPLLPMSDGASTTPGAGALHPSLARYADFSAGAQRQRQTGMRASRLLWITLGAALLLAVVCAGVSLASFSAILGGPGIPGGGNGANGNGAARGSNATALATTRTATPTSDIVTTTSSPTTMDASPTATFPSSPTATATTAPTQPPTATPTPVLPPKLSVFPLFLSGSCFNADFHVMVSNAGGGMLSWTAPSKVDGIKIFPTGGFLNAGSSETVKFSGTSFIATVKIRFTGNGGSVTVTINCL